MISIIIKVPKNDDMKKQIEKFEIIHDIDFIN